MSGGTAGGGGRPINREARPYQGRRAGLVTRLVAATIDGVVVGLVLLAGYFGLSALVFSLASAFVVTFVYLTLAWTLSGRTYGYLVMGLRLLGRRDQPPGLVGSASRALFIALVPIGVFWLLVSRDNRSLQDVFLGTSVVYDWQPRAARARRPQ